MSSQVQRRESATAAMDTAASEWSDAALEAVVGFADPMILRGLLYQLTGDPSVAATPVHSRVLGLAEAMVLADHADADLLQSKAADLLKSLRDRGVDDLPIGPADRLPTSLSCRSAARAS